MYKESLFVQIGGFGGRVDGDDGRRGDGGGAGEGKSQGGSAGENGGPLLGAIGAKRSLMRIFRHEGKIQS